MKTTVLEIANKILQVFCIRITRHFESRFDHAKVLQVEETQKGLHVITGDFKYKVYTWYSIQYWVVPFTGWAEPFKYWGNKGNPRFLRITKEKLQVKSKIDIPAPGGHYRPPNMPDITPIIFALIITLLIIIYIKSNQ